MTMPLINPSEWEHMVQTAVAYGNELLDELQTLIDQWTDFLNTPNFVLYDRYGIPLCIATSEHQTLGLRYRHPLVLHGEVFATLVSAFDTTSLGESKPFQTLLLKTALTIMELTEWAETEAERRGEKVRLVMEYGLTPEVVQLLSLCGLDDSAGKALMAFETAMPIPFQGMEVLRRYLIAQAWRYRRQFPWLAYLPDGLLILQPWSREKSRYHVEHWLDQWTREATFPIRAYLQMMPNLTAFPEILKETQSLMQFANRFGLDGLINDAVERHMIRFLLQMTPESLEDLINTVLGPLLQDEHQATLATLKEYLACGQSLSKTAHNLYVHPNTVLYRVHHAEKLLGITIKDTEQLTNLWMALEGHTLLENIHRFHGS